MRRPGTMPLALLLAVVLGACDDGTAPDRQLTRAEAVALLASVVSASEAAGTSSLGAQGGEVSANPAADSPIDFSIDVESSHPCPVSGIVAFDYTLSGSWDAVTRAAGLALEGTQTHDDCAFVHEGVTITVDGDPALEFSAAAAAVNGHPTEPFTFEVAGALDWSTSDGRSGNCGITIDAVTDFEARTRTVAASVCGHTIEQTTSWT